MARVIRYFNPRSPHGERLPSGHFLNGFIDFNPRSPHGERHRTYYISPHGQDFNPRSPHGERRPREPIGFQIKQFQSTLPARGATYTIHVGDAVLAISIHAPRTGSDAGFTGGKKERLYFNPRSPHGERLRLHRWRRTHKPFQSTLPARGATQPRCVRPAGERISIHAPRTGSDTTATGEEIQIKISIHAPRTGSDSAK